MGEHRGLVGEHRGRVGEHRGRVGEHRGRVGEHRGRVGEHRGRVVEHRGRVGEHRGLVLEKVHAFTGKYVTSRIGTKRAVMLCNPNLYLTEFVDRELPETVNAQVEEDLLLRWAGARYKP